MVYRAAIIGCGKIGSEFADDPRIKDIYTHAGAYTHCPDTELVAVCDMQKEKSDTCRQRWNVPNNYTDYRVMLAETEPDIVSVCTPDETHFEVIRTIIESSSVKAIFAEKPLATNLKDAENVVSLASERGVILAVNYIRRYAKKIVELQGFINAESFGGIQAINGYYTKGTFHNGTHWFDLARLLIGEIKRVKGFDIRKETNDDPSLDAVLEFPEGVFGYVHACDSQKFSIFEMDIIGNNGRICIKESGQTIEISHVGENPYYSGYNSLLLSDVYTNSMQNTLLNAVEDLVLCLETGKLPDCSGNDGVAAIRIAGAIRQSALSGQWVSTE